MNTPRQTLICNPEIEWSELLSISSYRPFRVSSHLPCLCECVRLIALLRQLLASRAANLTKQPWKKQNTAVQDHFISEYYVKVTYPTVWKRNTSHAMQIQIKVKRNCKVNRANIFAEKIKVEGSVTFQNIFSSIMADFRAVVSVLPCSPTNKGKKNLCGCAEKANRQWAFVAFWLSSYVNIKTAAAFADWLAPKRAHFSV